MYSPLPFSSISDDLMSRKSFAVQKRWIGIATAALGIALVLSSGSAVAAEQPPGHRQVPPVLTLAQAQAIAVQEHPNLRSRDLDVAAAQQAVNVAKAPFAPQVNATAVTALTPPGTRISAYGGINDPTVIQRGAFGIGISQYISDFGRTRDLVRAAELDLQGQAAARDASRDLVLLNVTEAYYEVLRANALLIVAEQTQAERRTFLRLLTALQHAGLRSTLDLAIATRDLSEADQLVLQGRNGRDDAWARLAEAMGSSRDLTYTLQPPKTLPPLPSSIDSLLGAAYRTNPTLANLQAAFGAAQSRAAAARQLRAPTIEAYGYAGLTPLRDAAEPINRSYEAFGIALNVPIFSGGALKAERTQTADAAMAAAAAVEAQRNTLARDVRIAYDGVQTTHGNIGLTEHLLSTARSALALTRAGYRIGSTSFVELSEAQLTETQAAIARTNAMYDYIVKDAALAFATGIIGDSHQLAAPASPTQAVSRAPSPSPPPARHRRFPS
jgi:outer membrane protein